MEIDDNFKNKEDKLHSIEWGHPTWAEGEPRSESNKSIRNRYDRVGGFNYAASAEVPWNDFNLMIIESIKRKHFSKEEITVIFSATETQLYNTEKAQKKLLFILIGLFVINVFLLKLGPGLGGNYMKNMDTMLWVAPFGCVIWGFLLGTILTLIPFKGLTYVRKYLITSLFISIILNLFILLMAFGLILE